MDDVQFVVALIVIHELPLNTTKKSHGYAIQRGLTTPWEK